MIKIAPSILSADFSRLADEIRLVEAAGADLIHVDVMDGHFVPNISIGQPVIKSIRKVTDLPLDVHLMIENPDTYLKSFIEAGSDIITIHPESKTDLRWAIDAMRDAGVKPGITLKPATQVSQVEKFLPGLDVVMIMSVEPGFGGQAFLEGTLDKVDELRKTFKGEIEIDGGINKETISLAAQAGVDICVAGTAVFGASDPAKAIRELKAIASERGEN